MPIYLKQYSSFSRGFTPNAPHFRDILYLLYVILLLNAKIAQSNSLFGQAILRPWLYSNEVFEWGKFLTLNLPRKWLHAFLFIREQFIWKR